MESRILNFYNGTNVLITGGTGFLGKILIEKLLRSTSVSTIYIVVRPKRGKNVDARIKDLFNDIIFTRLQEECPKFLHKIVGIPGDVSLPDLSLSESDRQMLIEKIDVVFHVAATVRFDENLKLAYNVNVNGTKDILEISKQMKKLKALMHVSTAFSNCHLETIEEKFYEYSINGTEIGHILEKLTVAEADSITPKILQSWPNTYTFTKALAESIVKENFEDLPIGVFRPAIVISTYKEPIPSWIDNIYGPTGVVAGVCSGFLRVLLCDQNKCANLVPVDMCVSALIASAWETSEKFGQNKKDDSRIYNFVSENNPITWKEYNLINKHYGEIHPANLTIWTQIIHMITNAYLYTVMKFFLHFIPGLLFDLFNVILMRKPRFLNIYKKIHKLSNVLGYFATKEWKFSNDNVVKLWNKLEESEKKLFFFDMSTLDWWAYFKTYLLGIRRYILKESDNTLEEARKRRKMFDMMHNILLACIYFATSVFIWTFVFQKLLNIEMFRSC